MNSRSERTLLPTFDDRTAAALSLALALWLGTSVVHAQASAERNDPASFETGVQAFSEIVDVRLINVDVGVVDRDGNPVLGLGLDDFEVLQEGKPVAITNFFSVESGARLVEGAGTPVTQQVSTAETQPEEAGADETSNDLPNYLAVLFDNSQIEARNRNRLLKDLERFLDREGQGDLRVLLASLGEDYTVLQGFTNDSRELNRALRDLRKLPATRSRDEASLRVFIRTFESQDIVGPGTNSRLDASARRSELEIDRIADAQAQRVRNSLGAIEYLMTTMAGLPGRKSLLYVSDGLPLRPGASLYHMLYNRYSYRSEEFDEPLVERPEIAALKYDLTPRFEQLVAYGQTNQVALFAIDAAGQRSPYAGGAGSSRGDIASFDTGGGNPVWDQRLDLVRTQNLQEGLRLAADETGGTVFANTRSYEAFLDTIRSQLDNYYSLGYPTESASTKPRKIEVRVRNPEWKVKHLEGVVYKDKAVRLTDRLVAELLHGAGTNHLGLAVETGEVRREGKTRVVPIRITVPLAALTFLPHEEKHDGSATVALMVSDAPGSTSPPQQIPLRLSLNSDEYPPPPERLAEATIEIQVRPGKQTLGVALRDELGQTTASIQHEFSAR